jgi:hypothetical protein
MGLSQGIFQVSKNAAGQTIFSRGAIQEGLIDARTGRPTSDTGMRFTSQEFSSRVRSQGAQQ